MIPAQPLPPQAEPPGKSWPALWREAVRDPVELLAMLGLEDLASRLSPAAMAQFPLRVPRGFVARMRPGDPRDPLLRQVLPLDDEERLVAGFGLDAVGDAAARAGTGIIRKYRGRALLVASGSCAVHCRYCFRRHFPYAEETAAGDRWRQAVDFLRRDDGIHEVILSGGDPLSLATAKLDELTRQLAGIPHIRRLRVHTRLPVVLPERVDGELAGWIAGMPWPVVVVVHANHANEVDTSVRQALARLAGAGARLLNQSVLLQGVNDDEDALADLSEALFAAGVLPYYLHLLDRVAGTAHYDVDEARAKSLHAAIAARLPGYLLPRLVREVAGHPGKTAV